MVELEVQVLAHEREGLLMDMGRVVAATGFSLQRQRLVQGAHGALLTLLIRGPGRGQRALNDALGGHARVVSFTIEPGEDGAMRPHFAAVHRIDRSDYVPPPAPAPPVAVGREPVLAGTMPPPPPVRDPEALAFFDRAPERSATPASIEPVPSLQVDADPPWEAWPSLVVEPTTTIGPPPVPAPPAPPLESSAPVPFPVETVLPVPVPAPAPAPPDAYVDIVPLDPDKVAVETLMRALPGAYPSVLPLVRALDKAVEPGAREPSLLLAGSRVGAWIASRQAAHGSPLPIDEALVQWGLPVLRTLVDAQARGGQVHLGASPLCGQSGHSCCAFFAGLLQGALSPVLDGSEASVLALCCRAWGADECVLAVAD